MKQKGKSKAVEFLKKYQGGGIANTGYPVDDNTLMQNPYQYDSSFDIALQNQIVQPYRYTDQSAYVSQTEQSQSPSFIDKAIPFLSPAINLGIGIKNLFEARRLRKKQQQYEKAYQKDLRKRQETSRTEDYYYTPYFQQGGEFGYVGNVGNMNEMDNFINYYTQQEGQNDLIQQQLQGYYDQKNQQLIQDWKNKKQSGFQNVFSGLVSALPLLQEGGQLKLEDKLKEVDIDMRKAKEINKLIKKDSTKYKDYQRIIRGLDSEKFSSKRKPSIGDRFREHQEGGEYNPKIDLYSTEYDPKEFLGVQEVIENEISQAQIEDKELSTIEQWLFQDEPEPVDEELNIEYFNPESLSFTAESTDVLSKIGQQESGGNYEAKNPYSSATGKYQFTKVWSGQIKSFMGLPQTFNADQVMEAFRKSPQAQEGFMQHVHENIYKPEIEKLRPFAKKYGLDDSKLERMLHYRGLKDTKDRLLTGNFEVSQAEKDKYKNPSILEYLNK